MDNRNGTINKAQLLSCLKQVRDQLHDQAPLIHCITHPIVVNDCANAVLALGGRPIMAEHPAEVADISASAAALTVSLGNITDARAESMLLAGKAIKRMKDAENAKRASVIDLVGITGTYLAVTDALTACILAAITLDCAGECANAAKGLGTYHIELINQLSVMTEDQITQLSNIQRLL